MLVKNSSPPERYFQSSSSTLGNCFSIPSFGKLQFLDPGGVLLYNKTIHASVAELVDAQDLGSCALCIRVRVPSLAPKKAVKKWKSFFHSLFYCEILSERDWFSVVSAFQDTAHGFIIHFPRVFRGAGVQDGIVSDGILLFQVQLFRNTVIFEGKRNVHHAV